MRLQVLGGLLFSRGSRQRTLRQSIVSEKNTAQYLESIFLIGIGFLAGFGFPVCWKCGIIANSGGGFVAIGNAVICEMQNYECRMQTIVGVTRGLMSSRHGVVRLPFWPHQGANSMFGGLAKILAVLAVFLGNIIKAAKVELGGLGSRFGVLAEGDGGKRREERSHEQTDGRSRNTNRHLSSLIPGRRRVCEYERCTWVNRLDDGTAECACYFGAHRMFGHLRKKLAIYGRFLGDFT